MAAPTHVVSDMTSDTEIKSYVGPAVTLYRFQVPLRALNGMDFFARSISKLPRPGWPEDFTQDELVATHFLQAGGSSDAMTVEVRKDAPDGVQRQYKLGHQQESTSEGVSPSPPTAVEIRIGDNVERVFPNELFSADEAAEIFYFYCRRDNVPSKYVLRKIRM